MNIKALSFCIIASILAFAKVSTAQTEENSAADPSLNKEVEVVKAYQPTVNDAMKILSTPKIVDTMNYTPTFEYNILNTSIPSNRTINTLPSVKLGNAPRVVSNTGFLKAGFGNAYSPIGEFVLNTAPTNKSEFGMHLFHFYSKPNIKLETSEKQKIQMSDNIVNLFAKRYFQGSVFEWDGTYQRNRFDYFGFPSADTALYNKSLADTSSLLGSKQVLNHAATSFRLTDISSKNNIDYDITLDYDFIWNTTKQRAHNGGYSGDYKFKLDKFDIITGSKINYYYQSNINNAYNDNTYSEYLMFKVDPQVVLSDKLWEVKLGLNFNMLSNSDTSSIFHVSPKIYFAYTPIEGILSVFAGTDGNLVPNNYASAIKNNMYMTPSLDTRPTNTKISIYGGFKGKFSRNISYIVDVNYSIADDELFYYQTIDNTGNNIVYNTFDIEYDKLSTLRFGGQVRYSSSKFNLALSGNYYNYKRDDDLEVLYRPNFRAAADASFVINDRITAKVGVGIAAKHKAAVKNIMLTTNSETIPEVDDPGLPLVESKAALEPSTSWSNPEIPMAIETYFEANYMLSNKLSIFVTGNNLLNRNNGFWYGYSSPGILFMAGVRYLF